MRGEVDWSRILTRNIYNLFINIEFIMFLVIYQLTISRIFKTGCQIKLR